jgi:hypothetical protein
VHCVQQIVNADKQVINFELGTSVSSGVGRRRLDRPRLRRTKLRRQDDREPQQSFDDALYRYDITFSASIEPKK